jgi:general secretion pathway protein F
MRHFRYRALTQSGDVVSGSISAPTASEVANRIEYLGLVPIEDIVEQRQTAGARLDLAFRAKPSAEDISVFTRDLALLLKAGAHINDGLELLAQDSDIGRLRPIVGKIRVAVLSGESFADALSHHPALFPPLYVAVVRVGEMSGTLERLLEVLGNERTRAEALRRRLGDALRYPAFVLLAASCVLVFFLLFVLPQFASVLRDFNAKLDPIVIGFLGLSDFLRDHTDEFAATLAVLLGGGWLLLRRPGVRAVIIQNVSRLPLVRRVTSFYRTALFCRNLGVLLGSGVALTTTLRILADMMAATGNANVWTKTIDRVRHGGKLSEAVADTAVLPAMAIRMLRLGEETGQLPVLAGRVAEFYEGKLQRSLDRLVGMAGPLAIIVISIVVGGLIVSVMTALLSVSQIVG